MAGGCGCACCSACLPRVCLFPVGSVIAQDTSRAANSLLKLGGTLGHGLPTRKADALIARMTTAEKVGQLVLFSSPGTPNPASPMPSALEDEISRAACGNVFSAQGVAYLRKLQTIAVEKTRLKIPLLFGYDTIHGFKTIFPIPLGEAHRGIWRPLKGRTGWRPLKPRRRDLIGPSRPWWTSAATRAGAGSPKARARTRTSVR